MRSLQDAIERQVWCLGLVLALICGCVTSPRQTQDEASIRTLVETWAEGVKTKDLDLIMSVYSEAYKGPHVGDKAGMRAFNEMAIEDGLLDNAQVFAEEMKIEVDGNSAVVGPITLKATFGQNRGDFILKKEDGNWRVVNTVSY